MGSHDSVRYLIAGMRRSGTTVTHHCLRGHPNVRAARREVRVYPFFHEGPDTILSGEPIDEKERGREYNALFEGIVRCGDDFQEREDSVQPCPRGVKCAFGTSRDAEMIVDTLRRYFPEVRVVYVVRKDAVAQFGSLRRAGRTGIWHRREKGEGHDAVELCLDPYNFADFAVGTLEVHEIMSRLRESHDVLDISYEDDILEGDITTHDPLFEFVGLSPRDATWVQDRKLSPPPREYITNYEQIRKLWDAIRSQYEAGESVAELRQTHGETGPWRVGRRMLFWGQRPIRAVKRLLG